MTCWKVTLTPTRPYFFGTDKRFSREGENNPYGSLYYISGNTLPTQSAVLGALRYLLLPYKEYDLNTEKADQNRKMIGAESFRPDAGKKLDFGWIKSISPIFITDDLGNTYLPTPLDHDCAAKDVNTKETPVYAPFTEYTPVETPEGVKLFTDKFDVKEGLPSSFICLETGRLTGDMFSSVLRVGNNRQQNEDGFFKRKYQQLKQGFSFSVYVELDEKFSSPTDRVVMMGQGRTPFTVRFDKKENDLITLSERCFGKKDFLIPYDKVICLSDTFLPDGSNDCYDPYKGTFFAVTDTIEYRSSTADSKGRVTRGESLYRLLKAGSIFLTETGKGQEWAAQFNKVENVSTLGYNTLAVIHGKENEKQ